MSEIAILVENISKQYHIGRLNGDRRFGYQSLRDTEHSLTRMVSRSYPASLVFLTWWRCPVKRWLSESKI
jgi:hypothetical protein